jgi:hypothetical protein
MVLSTSKDIERGQIFSKAIAKAIVTDFSTIKAQL